MGVEGGERQLFPLLPGTKCPTGHHCRVRTTSAGMNPMMGSLKDNLKTPLAATLDWQELNNNLNTVVASNDYCSLTMSYSTRMPFPRECPRKPSPWMTSLAKRVIRS